MDELLQKIYEMIIYHEEDTKKLEKNLEVEMHRLIDAYSSRFDKEQLEIITNLMYAFELKSLEAGFEQGMKYSLRFLIYLLSDL